MPTAIQDTSTESLTGILTNVASHPNQITGLFAQASKDPEATSSSRPTPKDCPPYITTAATTSPSPRPSAPKTYFSQCGIPICAARNGTVTVHINPAMSMLGWR